MITVLCALLGIAACTKSTTENTYNGQEVKIDSYVTKYMESHPESRVAYSGSVVRIVVAEGEGEELEKGGTASILYAGYNFNSTSMSASTLFATNDSDVAAAARWNVSDESGFGPREVSIKDKDLVEGLRLGLPGVRKGEDCIIIFSGRHGFGRQVGTIPANAALAYRVQVLDIMN